MKNLKLSPGTAIQLVSLDFKKAMSQAGVGFLHVQLLWSVCVVDLRQGIGVYGTMCDWVDRSLVWLERRMKQEHVHIEMMIQAHEANLLGKFDCVPLDEGRSDFIQGLPFRGMLVFRDYEED